MRSRGGFWDDYRRERGGNYYNNTHARSGRGFYDYRRENDAHGNENSSKTVSIPQNAVGLILGKKGRNIKELNQIPGIEKVQYDNRRQLLIITGTPTAVTTVDDKVFTMITRAMGSRRDYFSRTHITHVPVELDMGSTFEEVTQEHFESLLLAIPDDLQYKKYFALSHLQETLQLVENFPLAQYLRTEFNQQSRYMPEHEPRVMLGFDEEQYLNRFMSSFNSALALCLTRPIETTVELRIGKLFFHDIPRECTVLPFRASELQEIQCPGDIRAKFTVQLDSKALSRFQTRLLDLGYEHTLSRERIKVNMVDEESFKMYGVLLIPTETGQSEEKEEEFSTSTSDLQSIERVFQSTNYYEILGVTNSAGRRDIILGYRKTAKKVHPDKNRHGMATEAFKLVGAAYDCLKDQAKRSAYDAQPIPLMPRKLVQEATDTSLPQPHIAKLLVNHNKIFQLDIGNSIDSMDFRLAIDTKENEASENPDVLEYLQDAWQGQVDGKMQFPSGRRFRISTVRYRTEEIYEGNSFEVSIRTIRQDDRGNKTDVAEHVEVTIKSLVVETLLSQGVNLTDYELEAVKEEAGLMLQEAKTLCSFD